MEVGASGVIKATVLFEGNTSDGKFGCDWIMLKLADGREVLYCQETCGRSVESTVVSSDSQLTSEEAVRIAEDIGYFFSRSNPIDAYPAEGKNVHRW